MLTFIWNRITAALGTLALLLALAATASSINAN